MFVIPKMGKVDRKKIMTIFLVAWITIGSTYILLPKETDSIEPFFTLVAKTYNTSPGAIYFNYLKVYLSQIGIDLEVIVQDWSTFVSELITFRDFDLCYVEFTGGGYADPDFTGVYDENGSLNLFGYDTSMDWDEELGTGINEWYMKQGTLIIPPDSEERRQHYWTWQQYLMDKITPCIPMYTKTDFTVNYAELDGFSAQKGLLESWGKMEYSTPLAEKNNYSEILVNGEAWTELNPLNYSDIASWYLSSFILDPLIYFDSEKLAYPHLAKDWTFINDTHLRITLREDIKWQPDPDGNFTNEYFDVHDVYFTLYCYYLKYGSSFFNWLEDFKIIDSYTIDLFIDANKVTPENEPTATFFPDLAVQILPEHYLNQTQLADGITPNSTHISWFKFNNQAFGTGLFQIKSSYEDPVTILDVFSDCWFLDPLVTSDPSLYFSERFGNFSNGLTTLKFKMYSDISEAVSDFASNDLDILNLGSQIDLVLDYLNNPAFEVGKIIDDTFDFIGFNIRETRPHIGDPNPAPMDTTMTKGLCVRKAISYVIDWENLGLEMHSGVYERNYCPIYPCLGIWKNPNIRRYDYRVGEAGKYMTFAGYDLGWTPTYDDFDCGWFIVLMIAMFAAPFILVALFIGLVVGLVIRSSRKKATQKYEQMPIIMKTPVDPLEDKIKQIIAMKEIEEGKEEVDKEKEEINGENN